MNDGTQIATLNFGGAGAAFPGNTACCFAAEQRLFRVANYKPKKGKKNQNIHNVFILLLNCSFRVI